MVEVATRPNKGTSMKVCDYGCGLEAKYQFENGKLCCSKSHNSCPNMKLINKLKMTGKNKGNVLSVETRNKMSKSKTGLQINEKNPFWRGGYNKKGIPTYDQYSDQFFSTEEVQRNNIDRNILEVKCTYCGGWYVPKLHTVIDRIRSINSIGFGEHRFYCSDKCKKECSIFNQTLYPKGYKPATSREVQPELRQLRFKLDDYTCKICNVHQDKLKVGLHCHHLEGIRWEPLESADLDKCITVCKSCHIKIHKKEGCNYNDLKCQKEKQ